MNNELKSIEIQTFEILDSYSIELASKLNFIQTEFYKLIENRIKEYCPNWLYVLIKRYPKSKIIKYLATKWIGVKVQHFQPPIGGNLTAHVKLMMEKQMIGEFVIEKTGGSLVAREV